MKISQELEKRFSELDSTRIMYLENIERNFISLKEF
jgi:hypothetical protein